MKSLDRPTIDLDGEWRFIPDPERLYQPDSLPAGDRIRVPGCWEAQVDRPYRIISAWYRRSVTIPSEWEGSRVLIRFGAVMYRCSVWLNGRWIGEHEGGYTPFVVHAQDAVRWGEENDLVVEVINPLNAIAEYPAMAVERVLLAEELVPDLPLSQAPHGKQTWYSSMSGIWQSVRIERVPQLFLTGLRVSPDVGGERAILHWSIDGWEGVRRALPPATGDGAGGSGREQDPRARLDLWVLDPDGREISRETVSIAPVETTGEVSVAIPEPKLWDIGQPNLYRAEARLLRSGEVLDRLVVRFGMRSIETSDRHVLLNGRPIYLLGALDQDMYAHSMADPVPREFLDEQFRRAREMGLNVLRCHIKVPDPMYLDAADEAGILLWCELPNWTKFTSVSAARGQATLRAMVEEMFNHPSVVIWTIINEDWGTELRYEARDRQWLREMYDWLKEIDPTRLVVDNSACETPQTPNFHLKTDLADFHCYFGMPDNAVRWRNWVSDYAKRPAWLWSPHGDASPTGSEPLVVSEFGNWGLPRLDRLVEHYGGREPWWFGTGMAYYRPSGLRRRFKSYGLDRIWEDVNELADATQWHEFQALQFEIGQLRRHAPIRGYVITEFTDAYWEANGLLDITRRPKVFHERLADINAPDVIIADIEQRDLWGGGVLSGELVLSSYGDPLTEHGRIEWRLVLEGGRERRGEISVDSWPRFTSHVVGRFQAQVPKVERTTDARLELYAYDSAGHERARDKIRLAVLPDRGPIEPALNVAVQDPMQVWGVADRLEALGQQVVGLAQADLLVATEMNEDVLHYADNGGKVLVLVRTRDAVPPDLDLARRVGIHLRRLPHAGWPGQRSPWEGDWVTGWNWILPDALPGLPDRNPLDFAYSEVLPDHVLLGYDPIKHRDEVIAGMFVGWVHTPAALIWTFPQGKGSVTLTTLRLTPTGGPVATTMLRGLLARTAGVTVAGGETDEALRLTA